MGSGEEMIPKVMVMNGLMLLWNEEEKEENARGVVYEGPRRDREAST